MKIAWIIALLFVFGCYQQNKNQIPVQEVIKSHEIRQLSDAEILAAGEIKGLQIKINTLDSIWGKAVMNSGDCTKPWGTTLDDKTIAKLGFGLSDFASELEWQLFEAYQYNVANNLDLDNAIQKIDRNTILFCVPVLFTFEEQSICQVQTKMPKDSVPSFGMWSIKIPVKEIIKSM